MNTQEVETSRGYPPRKNRVISILNNKGGVLKTTIAFNLAKNYLRSNRKVTAVDFDQQKVLERFLPENTVLGADPKSLDELDSDYIIVDTGPSFDQRHFLLMANSDVVLVPCPTEGSDLEQVQQLLETAQLIGITDKIKIIIIHEGHSKVMYKLLRPAIQTLSEDYGVQILCEIQKCQDVSQANLAKKSVFEHRTRPDVRKEYKTLFTEVGKCLVQ